MFPLCYTLAASLGGLLASLMLGDVTSQAKAPLWVYCLDRLCGQAQRWICLAHGVLQMSELSEIVPKASAWSVHNMQHGQPDGSCFRESQKLIPSA